MTWINSVFVYFPQSMVHKWNKNGLECSTIEFFEHTASCKFEKRLSQTFVFYLCEPRLPRNFSILLQYKRHSFAQYLFQFHIGHTKMRFKPVKLRNFCCFHRGLKRQFFNDRQNPSKCLKNLKLRTVRQKKSKALMPSLPCALVL